MGTIISSERGKNQLWIQTTKDIIQSAQVIVTDYKKVEELKRKLSYFPDYEYIEKNKALISGNRDKKVVVYYELKFVTDLREFISVCPYCGAKSPDTFKRICDYCNQTVEETELNWLLNQENIVIKSYGDDI